MAANEKTVVTVPRTAAFMARFNARMRFLLGADVQIGCAYRGWESLDGRRYEGRCRAVRYDGECLYLYEPDREGIALLEGDAADDGGWIVADRCCACWSLPELRARVDRYMAKNGIETYDPEVGYKALWLKMAPPGLIRRMAVAYELGRETTA